MEKRTKNNQLGDQLRKQSDKNINSAFYIITNEKGYHILQTIFNKFSKDIGNLKER